MLRVLPVSTLTHTTAGELRDVFVEDLDNSDSGIHARIRALHDLLRAHDPELARHLEMLGLDPTFYSLRWITTLLSREFNLPDTLRLWDSLFSEPTQAARMAWLTHFCVCMLLAIRDQLLAADFPHALDLLQCYPPSARVDELLEHTEALLHYNESSFNFAGTAGGAVGLFWGVVYDWG